MNVHWLPGCAPGETAPPAVLDLEALGDFDPGADTHAVLDESARGERLGVPADSRAFTLEADDGFGHWTGESTLRTTGAVDLSLWPVGGACTLPTPAAYPAKGGGQGIGVSDGLVLVVGGVGAPSSALVLDTDSGGATLVDANDGPRTRRSGATVTAFGNALLVAGGTDTDAGTTLGSADVFDVASRRFEPDRVELESPRTRHAAVTLASGETLLVGGVGAEGRPLATLEAISPASRRYRISGLTDLLVARADPLALRLTDDRVLVAGGTDATGAPVEQLEWLAADASRVELESVALVHADAPTTGRAFVAMPGGSALAVGGCTPGSGGEAGTAGCLPSRDVYWIPRDGAAIALPNALDVDVDAARPLLAPGAEGRPWLVASGPGGSRVLRRFDPWLARFVVPESAPLGPQDPEASFFAADPGLLLWLSSDGDAVSLSGFRHGTRNAYSESLTPLLLASTDGVSLDRPPVDAFDTQAHELTLRPAEATLSVTDTTYRDLYLSIDMAGGPPPIVLLGTRAFGGEECPWPGAEVSTPYTLALERHDTTVRLVAFDTVRECPGPADRVSVLIEAGGAPVRLRSVRIHRSPS